MSEKESRVMELMRATFADATEEAKTYILAFAEGMAAAMRMNNTQQKGA